MPGSDISGADLASADPDGAAGSLGSADVAACGADVSRAGEVAAAVAATVARWGRIDVLFSNAGNFGTVAPIESYPEDVFDAVYRVHVRGAFLACKYAVPTARTTTSRESSTSNADACSSVFRALY